MPLPTERSTAASSGPLAPFPTTAEPPGGTGGQLVQTAKLAEIGMAMAELVHQLRQPLSGISGFAQLLASDPRGRDAEGWIEEILAQSERMEQMIERMRRFLKPGDDGPIEPVDVAAALKEAVAILPRMPPGVGLELHVATDLPRVRARANELVQVFGNLLANAREALADTTEGRLLVRASTKDGCVEVLVADQGCGIPAHIRERLFSPFATSKGENGTGLGLYICRELLAACKGELLLLEPPPESFATAFVVRLPGVSAAPAPTPAKRGSDEGALETLVADMQARIAAVPASARVLLVDDEPVLRRALRVLLAAEPGLEVLEAGDGPEALEVLAREAVHLIVADKRLPGMSGTELLRRASSQLPVEAMVVTGFPSPQSVVEALEAGARDYFLKPLASAEAFRARTRDALARQRGRQLVRTLGPVLRGWADRVLQALPSSGAPALRSALQRLCDRPDGVPTLAVFGSRGDVELAAVSGNRPRGPHSPRDTGAVLGRGDAEVVLVGDLDHTAGLEIVRQARASEWAPAVVWAAPVGGFDDALALLRAGVTVCVPAPVDAAGVAKAIGHAARVHREELRALALQRALQQLGIAGA